MKKYKHTVRQVIISWIRDNNLENDRAVEILKETVEEKWRPKMNDKYFCPNVNDAFYPYSECWANYNVDNFRLKHNLVFKTKKEAVARTKELLGIGGENEK